MNSVSTLTMLIMTFFIGYLFSYPMYLNVDSLNNEKLKRLDSLNTIFTIEQKKNDLLKEYSNISEKNRNDIDTILPNSFDFVRLTSDVDLIAKKNNVLIKNVLAKNLEDPNPKTIGDASNQKGYNSGIIAFTFKSNYEQFLSFLDELEKSLRIMDVKSLKVKSQQNNQYEFMVDFEVYWI